MGQTVPPIDPGALIRSKGYAALLVLAAIVGIAVSLAGWVFLELVAAIQHWVSLDLPVTLGMGSAPWWWPIPWVTLAGLPVAVAIVRLPGHGGHRPAAGLKSGPPTMPIDLPGVMLAAVAGLGLGIVLGPEAPLIALGGGLGILTVRLVRRGAPDQVMLVMAAAGSFAAISTIFGNPVVGAVIIIEAAGLGGPTLPLVLLPGLLAAGIGSVVFLGMGNLTGLSESAYALGSLGLPPAPPLVLTDFFWAILIAVIAAVMTRVIVELAVSAERYAMGRPFVLIPVAGLTVAILAVVFAAVTSEPANLVLFSGQDAMVSLVQRAPALSAATLGLVVVFKGLAWAVSLGGFRGGPTFPAMFIGLVVGLFASRLTGLPEASAVAIGMGAMTASMLRLPLSAVILATVVTQAGVNAAPLIILAVVAAYIVTEVLVARRPPASGPETVTTGGHAPATV